MAKNLRYAEAMKMELLLVCVTADGKIVSGSEDDTGACVGYAGQRTCDMQRP